jgi:hypothetical protein
MVSVDAILGDMYAAPGTRLKQWVVDMRREHAWQDETCPRVFVVAHTDNTGDLCRNNGQTRWYEIDEHDCCTHCSTFAKLTEYRVSEWLFERARRPPICADREKLSDEIQEDISLRENPFFAFTRRDA